MFYALQSYSQRSTDRVMAKKVIVFGWETTCKPNIEIKLIIVEADH